MESPHTPFENNFHPLVKALRIMLSRVADSIYWTSRYVERAENLARFVEVTFASMLDLPTGAGEQWLPLVSTTGDGKWFAENYGEPNRDNVVHFLTFDTQYPNSILSAIAAARENARSIRESIPSQVWEQINQFYQRLVEASRNPQALWQSPLDFYQEIKLSSYLFKGLIDGSMSHGEGWHFAQLGRYLERADKTTRMVDVQYYRLLPSISHVGTPIDDLQWSALLHSVGGFEMYRKQYHQITPQRVVEFLILDRYFPSSVMYCIEQANQSVHAITGCPIDSFCNTAEQKLGRLRNDLAFMSVDEIISIGMHQFIDSLQKRMNDVGAAIFRTFIDMENDSETTTHRSQRMVQY